MDYASLFAYYTGVCAPAIAKLEDFHIDNYKRSTEVFSCDSDSKLFEEETFLGVVSLYPEIHNEIRMAFSHLARTTLTLDDVGFSNLLRNINKSPSVYLDLISSYESDLPSDHNDDNIKKAYAHLQRAAMDSEKCLYLARIRKINDELNRYLNYSVEEVHSGRFFEEVYAMKNDATDFFEKAKIAESLGKHEVASRYYGESDKKASELEKFIDKKIPALKKAKKNYFKSPISLKWDFIVLVLSIAATVITLILD